MCKQSWSIPLLICLVLVFSQLGIAQNTSAAAVPGEISADLGPCSVLISVSGPDSKPIYGAKVTTRIQYGVFGVKKLDLEAFSGVDGRIKMANLPETLKKPMYIHITKDGKQEVKEFKPELNCHATFFVQLN